MASSNAAFLWQKSSDLGTFSGGSWEATLPLDNLKDKDVQGVARSTSASTANTKFRVDLGATPPRPVNAFTLINHNGTDTATWRIVVTSDASDAVPGSRVLDTGTLPLWLPTVTLGELPWGAFPWNGIDAEAYPSGTIAFYIAETVALARYIWVYIEDSENPAGYFEAGRFFAGVAWSPSINMNYGARVRWVDNSEVSRTLGGKRLVAERPKYREVDLSFSWLEKSEAFGAAFEIGRTLGKSEDFLVILRPDEGGEFLFKRSIYVSLKDTSGVEENEYEMWAWSVSAEEII